MLVVYIESPRDSAQWGTAIIPPKKRLDDTTVIFNIRLLCNTYS
jgi:hypothetical protein